MTNEHSSLEKYTSHTLSESVAKGLCFRDDLETEQTATYWPQILLFFLFFFLQHFFLVLLGCSTGGPEGPALCWELVLTASNYNSNFSCNWLQLTRTVCRTRLYHCLTPTCFLWASYLHPIQPVHGQGYILMSLTGCTCFSIDGWAEGQYVTDGLSKDLVTFNHKQIGRMSYRNNWVVFYEYHGYLSRLSFEILYRKNYIWVIW